MNKIIDVGSLFSYKEAAKKLEENKISYDKSTLINNPELCKEIIVLMDYFEKHQRG